MDIKIIEQFSVWLVDLDRNNIVGSEQGGKRPFLVISDTGQNIKSKTPVGFIGSSSPKKSKNIYTLSINLNNRKEHSHINFSQFTTLGEDRFIKKIDDKLFDDLAKEALKKFMNKIIKIDCSEL
jgi:mRNA-degrading endonuclease toxin of MazEF toxin-antitoxin module